MKKLKFITSNSGKFSEVSEILSYHGIEVMQKNIPCPEIQADTLEEVVSFCLDWLGDKEVYLIDDSGLFIDELRGFPGVYSSYVFKTLGNKGILRLMSGVPEDRRKAHFETVFGIGGGGFGEKLLFSGICSGRISPDIRGAGGFGYDPIFIPAAGNGRTFGEMSVPEKNTLSHRGDAVRNMMENADKILELLF